MSTIELEKLRIEKPALRPGGRRKRRLAGAVVLVLLLAAAAAAYRQGWLAPAVAIQTVLVQNIHPSQALALLNASGYVVADRKSAVASKVTGRLVFLGVEEGSRVTQGQVIARLESKDAAAARDRAGHNVAAARHQLAQARAEKVNAGLDYERKKALVEKGTISRSLFDAAEARFRTAAAAEEGLSAALLAAKAALAEAEVLLDYTNIRAPFDAVVLTKNADIGDIVTPLAATADAKAAVVTIADMESLLVEVDVSESNIGRVAAGQPCEIRLDAFPDRRFPGRVHMVLPTADRSKASITVKVAFEERAAGVLPEMSAKVAFLSRAVGPDEREPVAAVPDSAVARSGGGPRLFLLDGERVRAVPVTLGRRLGEMVELRAGPAIGSRIAAAPIASLSDGARVSVTNQ
ncbi:MAG: efflux RND transporter periplasmic adaptor subunit [Desulfobacterales bacterium]|jgi:RND family efflux transporter MFP subunit|nr:efflux RND transporter periplasmic adaptor subunit [Desulfobacterales bacterium]